jgi:peptide/nickel transport system substrate-binding protein
VASPEERLDALRARSTEHQNHLIDELRLGKIGRRDFIRRAAVAGMALPVAGFLASCATKRDSVTRPDAPQRGTPRPGGTFRVGLLTPAGALDPVLVGDQAGLGVLSLAGDYLIWSDRNLVPRPRLAQSWSHNGDGTVWTFKIREGVTFHDGTPMDAEDVAATFNRLADPDNGSNALSALAGVLSKDSAKALDPTTVRFTLEAPNGNFPFLTSSDNYNAIILPKKYNGNWDKTFIGTGPWKLRQYRPDEGISLLPNKQYWDRTRQPLADKLEVIFYSNEQGQVLAFQGGQVDFVQQFSVSGGRAAITDPHMITTELRSAAHRQIHIRTDKKPLDDKRVRQAIALLVNRDVLVDGLLATKADYGNDSPFAPVFGSTAPGVAQRQQDVTKAKQLLEAAGVADGFSVQLDTWQGFEMPALAQVLQQELRAANIHLNLSITDSASYYGAAVFGNSRWLDSTMGITEYGHRGVPNVLLGAPLESKGTWNAAHFKNQTYDGLVKDYVAAIDLDSQRTAARQIQELLLDEVPILFTYFYYYLAGSKTNVAGADLTAMGCIDVTRAGFVD